MKKIVALVLTLAMVMGLATTAFGAPVVDKKLDWALNPDAPSHDWSYTVIPEDDADEKDATFATYSIEAVALDDGVSIWWATGTADEEDEEDVEVVYNGKAYGEFVVVASEALADLVLVDGNVITYYAVAEKYNEDGWDEKAVKVTLPVLPDAEADMECCTLYAWSPAATTFYEFNDTLYRAAKTTDNAKDILVFNVDGVVVEVVKAKMGDATRIDGDKNATYDKLSTYAAGDYVYTAHNYIVERQNDSYTNSAVTKVYCDLCKNEFTFVEAPVVSAAVAAFGAGNYFDLMAATNTQAAKAVYLAIDETSGAVADAPATAPEAGDKVESAETFDAGIAMYVGMSVMAAAGSAVVLKKKD